MKDRQAQVKIRTRLSRLEHGNFGDCKQLRSGIWELRIDYGLGYRVYYSPINNQLVILLLHGGIKRGQDNDIEKAITYLNTFKLEYEYGD
ncbi:MAG: type II toxin-antitoxin system RelE/ParE family toxin [Coxiellaceae bacterium]|nr:type II toxin-antitoxin system RelE/ParE family toxin [Coxiellaceae bacterium]